MLCSSLLQSNLSEVKRFVRLFVYLLILTPLCHRPRAGRGYNTFSGIKIFFLPWCARRIVAVCWAESCKQYYHECCFSSRRCCTAESNWNSLFVFISHVGCHHFQLLRVTNKVSIFKCAFDECNVVTVMQLAVYNHMTWCLFESVTRADQCCRARYSVSMQKDGQIYFLSANPSDQRPELSSVSCVFNLFLLMNRFWVTVGDLKRASLQLIHVFYHSLSCRFLAAVDVSLRFCCDFCRTICYKPWEYKLRVC